MAVLFYYVAFAITCFYVVWSRRRRVKAPYPPGPPADPLIGHLRVLPRNDPMVEFREMSKTYGDIMYFCIPGRSMLILNSLKTATELLDQRSGIYSDRMKLPIYEIMGWNAVLSLLPYGKRFQKHRRLMQEYLHEKQCVSYHLLQKQYARQLLAHLMDNPRNWMKHFERFSASVVVKITYGMDTASDHDPYLDIAEKAVATMTSCGPIGGTPVDILPFLRYFPSWFPGTYYANKARNYRSDILRMHDYPFETVQRQVRDGTAQPSYLSYYLNQSTIENRDIDDDHIQDLKGSAAAMFIGGVETTASALSFFMLAMTLFPEVQKRAQLEIDNVTEKKRLPEMNDKSSFPYVVAVMNEVLRWYPVVPTVPHLSTEDDVYNGMYIPKGTVVIGNAYAILRDETVYTDPDIFNPSRYLPKPEGNAEPYPIGHFGFGRRICPVQHLVINSLFISIVSILATLDIGRVKDENGNEIVPEIDLATGVTSHPKPFQCTIIPRDTMSKNLIQETQLWNEI